MKKRILFWALLGCSMSPALWAQPKKDLVKRLEALEAQNKQLAAENASQKQQLSDLEVHYKGQLADLHAQVDLLKNDFGKLKAQLAAQSELKPSDPESAFATIQWEETTHDFGTVKAGKVVEHIYKFKNTSQIPLKIRKVVIGSACACISVDYPKNSVAPGESGEILVRFDTARKSGARVELSTVLANTDPPQTILSLQGKVDKP